MIRCLFSLWFLINISLNGQGLYWPMTEIEPTYQTAYDDSKIFLQNQVHLFSLFDKLYSLKRRTTTKKVRIVHIGDSHLQADMMTSVLREEIQTFFGDGGRGIVFPYQVARTNGPNDYVFSSNATWQSSRISSPNQRVRVGLSGFGLQDLNAFSSLDFRSKNQRYFDYLKVITQKSSHTIELYNPQDSVILGFKKVSKDNYDQHTILLPYQIAAFQLQAYTHYFDSLVINGIMLENEQQYGVVYHTIGANGAKYSDYFKNEHFVYQLGELEADCYILSMGTNEAQDLDISQDAFFAELENTIKLLRIVSPNTPIIVSSPGCSYYKKRFPNTALKTIRNAMEYASMTYNVVFFDLYNSCNCEYSSNRWKDLSLLNRDLVHYTQKGYQLQGQLFINALKQSWNQYLIQTNKIRTEDR